jgi:hypothetical protein
LLKEVEKSDQTIVKQNDFFALYCELALQLQCDDIVRTQGRDAYGENMSEVCHCDTVKGCSW